MPITILVITILAFVVGIYLGSVIFCKEVSEGVFEKQNTLDRLEQQLRDSPIVDSIVLDKTVTKDFLIHDVLNPRFISYWHHFGLLTDIEHQVESEKFKQAVSDYADKIMQWYNPEFNELLLVAHSDGCGGFDVDFTWKQPKQKPSVFLCPREAVEGMEKYYNDNPIVIYKREV